MKKKYQVAAGGSYKYVLKGEVVLSCGRAVVQLCLTVPVCKGHFIKGLWVIVWEPLRHMRHKYHTCTCVLVWYSCNTSVPLLPQYTYHLSRTCVISKDLYNRRGRKHTQKTQKRQQQSRTSDDEQNERHCAEAALHTTCCSTYHRTTNHCSTYHFFSKPQKLRKAEGQAEILAGALGLDSDEEDDDFLLGNGGMDRGDSFVTDNQGSSVGINSFAALEQLSSRLRVATVELEALRTNLRESEKTRNSLVEELGESRAAKEKLPFFEAKVKELTEDILKRNWKFEDYEMTLPKCVSCIVHS
jgi:hypothetical protein